MRISSKLLGLWLILLTAAYPQVTLSGGAQVSGGTLVCVPPTTTGGPTFSPASYSGVGPVSVTMTCTGGKTPFYRTDGGPVTIASPMYTSPITVSSTTTIVGICATIGAYQTNVQADTASAVCYTASGGTFSGPPSTTCGSSGGVGTINPTNVGWMIATPANITMTTPATSATEVQALFEHLFSGNADPTPPRCDACKTQVQDFVLTASAGPATFANIETDMPQYMPTVYAPLTTGINRQNGLQCNQQSSGTGHGDWEVDSGMAGGWTDTTIPCSYSAGVPKEVVLRITHANGDTSCGGQGCANYTDLWDAGVHHTLGGTYGNTQGYAAQTGEKAWGAQKQPDFHLTSGTALTGTLTVSSETVAMGYGDESSTASATYTITSQVAAPTMSAAAGALAPGAATTPSDSTSGSTILYTWDGSAPAYTTLSGQIVPTGTTMEYRTADYPSGFAMYGPKTFKLIAVKSGLTDSAVATYAYTLTAPTGTSLSACGTLAASTAYYLSSNVSATGTCMIAGGNGASLNLNGHTITYGTAHTPLVNVTNATTNGTSTVTVASGTPFATCPTGDTVMVNDLSQNNVLTTVSSCPTSSSIIVASAPGWSASGNSLTVWPGSAVYGFRCDGSLGDACNNGKIYNGTITQSANINPQSHGILMGSYGQYGDNSNNVLSDLTFNINSQDVHAMIVNASPATYGLGDTIQFNTINDSSTVISNRDQFYGTPILITETGGTTVTSPVDTVNDNVLTESPQGSGNSQVTANVINNNFNAGTNIQYVGGYGVFLNRAGSLARGNNISGWQRGLESECGTSSTIGCTFDQNVVNTTDSSLVHDPNHNPNGCEIGGNDAFRVKNYNSCGGGNYKNTVVSNNILTVTANACPAQGLRFSQMNSGDTGAITNNQVTLVMSATATISASANYSADSGGSTCQEYMNGYTFSNNTQTISGSYASTGFSLSFDPGGATGWTQGNFASPVINSSAPSSLHSSGTFTGTGTATMHCNGSDTPTVTYNGVSVPCS